MEYINKLDLKDLVCFCGNSRCLTKHAYYPRKVKSCHGTISLKILRVKCSQCNRTHAIILSCMVPHSQILLKQLLEIVKMPSKSLNDVMISHNIDEAHIRYIKKQFRLYWKERIERLNVLKEDLLPSLCFHHFKLQFMQIRNRINIPFFLSDWPILFLFCITHIAFLFSSCYFI